MEESFAAAMEHIVSSLKSAGYDPHARLQGYLLTGRDAYITRNGNAQALIGSLDRAAIQRYLEMHSA